MADQALNEPPAVFSESERLSVCRDLQFAPQRVKDDFGAALSLENGLFLGAAAAGAAILRNNVDQRVIHQINEHGPQGGKFSAVLNYGGDPFLVHVPLLATMYSASLWQQNEDLHELALTMITSYKFSVLSSLTVQYATATRHTGNTLVSFVQDSGLPSEPTAASFSLAAVIDQKFGWKGGVPAYLTAGLIAWSEVDQHHHTVSEVVFGAALGYAIGKSIGAFHYHPDQRLRLIPFADPNSSSQGIAFEIRY